MPGRSPRLFNLVAAILLVAGTVAGCTEHTTGAEPAPAQTTPPEPDRGTSEPFAEEAPRPLPQETIAPPSRHDGISTDTILVPPAPDVEPPIHWSPPSALAREDPRNGDIPRERAQTRRQEAPVLPTQAQPPAALPHNSHDTRPPVAGAGRLLAWGVNDRGQLGDGRTEPSLVPTPVCAPSASPPCHGGHGREQLVGVVSTAVGEAHAAALLGDGRVAAWGHNDAGQLGDGKASPGARVPVWVCAVGAQPPCDGRPGHEQLSGVVAIATFADKNLAWLDDHRVVSWGEGVRSPQALCDPRLSGGCEGFPEPQTDSLVTSSPAAQHHLAVLTGGAVLAWGVNDRGQLGDGTTTSREIPTAVCAPASSVPCTRHLDGVTRLALGNGFSLAVSSG
ncbi:hypothetical protein [Amycolatopsis anabasis]|uniref:RCC1 domain-containing protein n=1 Tax=Amycolatopsis anabasis TaxID=1840409 RepID=UPI003CCD5A97